MLDNKNKEIKYDRKSSMYANKLKIDIKYKYYA